MLTTTLGMSERLACKAVGLARSTHRRLPVSQTPADPDTDMRAWLRSYAVKHPCHGFRRAWATLRYDERREVNKKKVHRLWREEGLQVKIVQPAEAGWGVLDSADRGRRPERGVGDRLPVRLHRGWQAIKIASMIDEHTRCSLLNLVERSITAELLVEELKKVFAAAGGPPKVLRMDNGPEFISQALQQFCDGKVGSRTFRPGRGTTDISNPSTTGYARSASTATTGTPCSKPAWSSATSRTSTTIDTATQRWATARRPSTLRPAGAPTPRWPAASTESGTKQPDSRFNAVNLSVSAVQGDMCRKRVAAWLFWVMSSVSI